MVMMGGRKLGENNVWNANMVDFVCRECKFSTEYSLPKRKKHLVQFNHRRSKLTNTKIILMGKCNHQCYLLLPSLIFEIVYIALYKSYIDLFWTYPLFK